MFNGTTSSFVYGSDGLRRRETTGGVTTDSVLDGPMAVRTLIGGTTDQTFLTGPRGPEYQRLGANAPVWYLFDGLGSVLGTVDSAGNIVSNRKYDVYGSVRSSAGPSGSKHKFVGALGHPSEDETGLVYMRARYMDVVTGRFVSEDPGRDGVNWFAYGGASPTNGADANGRWDAAAWWAAYGIWQDAMAVSPQFASIIPIILASYVAILGAKQYYRGGNLTPDDAMKAEFLAMLAIPPDATVLQKARACSLEDQIVGFYRGLAAAEMLFYLFLDESDTFH